TGCHRLDGAILEGTDACLLGAMGAAEHAAIPRLEAVADDAAVAMMAMRRHRRDGAFETVECHGGAALDDLEGLVVVSAGEIAFRHGIPRFSGPSGGLMAPQSKGFPKPLDPCRFRPHKPPAGAAVAQW